MNKPTMGAEPHDFVHSMETWPDNCRELERAEALRIVANMLRVEAGANDAKPDDQLRQWQQTGGYEKAAELLLQRIFMLGYRHR